MNRGIWENKIKIGKQGKNGIYVGKKWENWGKWENGKIRKILD